MKKKLAFFLIALLLLVSLSGCLGRGGGKGGGDRGGNDETPAPSPDRDVNIPTPVPSPSPTPTPAPGVPPQAPGLTGGISVNVTQDNDQTSTIKGSGNTVTQTQDNSVNTYGAYGTAGRAKAMRDKHVNMLKGGLTFTGY